MAIAGRELATIVWVRSTWSSSCCSWQVVKLEGVGALQDIEDMTGEAMPREKQGAALLQDMELSTMASLR